MDHVFTKTEIRRLWSQIVENEGDDKYTPQEFQESYEDFCRTILYDPNPIIRIDALENLEKGIINSQVILPNQTLPLARDDTPRPRPGQTSADKVSEMWQQRDASLKQAGRLSVKAATQQESVTPVPIQNNPPIFEEPRMLSQNQWNRPNLTPDVPNLENRAQNHDFLIPRAPPQQTPNRRFNSANPYIKPQPLVSNNKPQENKISSQEIYDQNRMIRSLPVLNANADPSRINNMAAESQIKKQKLDNNGQQSVQEMYDQNRMRRSVPVPNANADPSRIIHMPDPENIVKQLSIQETYDQNRMRRSVPVPNANADPSRMSSYLKTEFGKPTGNPYFPEIQKKEIVQEVKLPIAEEKPKVNPLDDWLMNFTDDSTNGIEQEISDTSDFFNNLPNPSMVIGKTSLELKAVLNNMQTDAKVPKKAKKRSRKSKQ